jgi:leucyl-tRNA synthetase
VLHEMGLVPAPEPYTRFRAHGMIIMDGAKMSKSRGNVLNPDAYIEQYGADTLRLFMMYLGPYMLGGDFRDKGIAGMTRFINRTWRATQLATGSDISDETRERRRHRLIKQVEDDIAELRYNTAIAYLMEFARDLDHECSEGTGRRIDADTLLKLLAPFAPFVTEELWERTGHEDSVHERGTWPAYDAELAAPLRATVAITVDGKLRGEFEVDAGTSQADLSALALANPRVVELLGGRTPRKVIAVIDRIVNIVTG